MSLQQSGELARGAEQVVEGSVDLAAAFLPYCRREVYRAAGVKARPGPPPLLPLFCCDGGWGDTVKKV